jgi:aspartate aminotransferase
MYLASETFSAVSAPIQYAAIKAYKNDHSNYINKSRKILSAVGNYVYENLKSNKVLINKPQGGFYLMPEFLNKKFNSSSEMCDSILMIQVLLYYQDLILVLIKKKC